MTRALLLCLATALPGCATTLDHQAELLLHPDPAVQLSALTGAALAALPGLPLWGASGLVAGPRSDFAAWSLHAFAYPGALLLGGLPWLVAGPSWRRVS